jgi:hypothetical protein
MPTWTTGGYNFPNYRPATPDPAPEITAGQRKAARDVRAMWISRDGSGIFTERFGQLIWAYWIERERRYSAWLECVALPEGAIKLDG